MFIHPRTFYYSSGWINSKYRFPRYTAKIEARIRVSKPYVNSNEQTETRSAFWLYGNFWDNTPSGNFEYKWNEIDIFELDEHKRHSHTLHFDIPNDGFPKGESHNPVEGIDETQWHVYTLEWNPSFIRFYIDGVQKVFWGRWFDLNSNLRMCPSVGEHLLQRAVYPKGPMEIVFSNHVQNILNHTQIHDMEVDYVRVYYKADCDKDIVITDPDSIPNKEGEFNFIIGRNITIDANFTLESGRMLKLIASESINVGPGLIVKPGAHLIKEIQPNICLNNSSAFVIQPDDQKLHIDSSQILHTFFNLNLRRQSENVNLTYSGIPLENPSFEIYDLQGKLISQKNVLNFPFNYSTKNLPSGIYVVLVKEKNRIIHNEKMFVNL